MKMTLENLVKIGKLKPYDPDKAELCTMFNAARRNLADAQLADLSTESRFNIAYRAIMQAALLAIMANGFRPSTSEPGHHATVLQTLPKTIGLSNERMVLLDSLRRKRNLSDYSGQEISAAEATACLRASEALLHAVEEWLHEHCAEVLD
jgi:hypothetical protein